MLGLNVNMSEIVGEFFDAIFVCSGQVERHAIGGERLKGVLTGQVDSFAPTRSMQTCVCDCMEQHCSSRICYMTCMYDMLT